jgi:hypothetical protein
VRLVWYHRLLLGVGLFLVVSGISTAHMFDSLLFDIVAREQASPLQRDMLTVGYDSTTEPLIVHYRQHRTFFTSLPSSSTMMVSPDRKRRSSGSF